MYQLIHAFGFGENDFCVFLFFLLGVRILEALGVSLDNAEGRFHFVGQLVNQIFAFGHELSFLCHLLLKPGIGVCQIQKGCFQIFREGVKALGQLSKFVPGGNGAGSGKIEGCHTFCGFIQPGNGLCDKMAHEKINEQYQKKHKYKPETERKVFF